MLDSVLFDISLAIAIISFDSNIKGVCVINFLINTLTLIYCLSDENLLTNELFFAFIISITNIEFLSMLLVALKFEVEEFSFMPDIVFKLDIRLLDI